MSVEVTYWNLIRENQANLQVRLQPSAISAQMTYPTSRGEALWLCCFLEDRPFEERLYGDYFRRLCHQS